MDNKAIYFSKYNTKNESTQIVAIASYSVNNSS